MYDMALFAGACGGVLGGKLLGWRTVCYVEQKPYPVEVIKARIRDGYLDDAPIWDDVTTFDGHPWTGLVDVISTGFPCQPFSAAGKRLGDRDERNLWPDTIRIIREVRPEWVLLENVTRLLSYPYIRRIFADLAESGLDCRWDCIPACAVGAPHIRDRFWLVAHADRNRYQDLLSPPEQSVAGWIRQEVPDSRGVDVEKPGNVRPQQGLAICHWWDAEPGLGRVVDGLAHRVDRLEAIGNGQVPAVVRVAWNALRE